MTDISVSQTDILSFILRPKVSWLFCLGINLGITTRFLLLSDSWGFVDVGRSLWREDGSVVHYCSWPSPAQLFSGSNPVGLVTIFYCFRFKASLFVTSYDWQGYGGGIRPRLHTGGWQSNYMSPLYNFGADQIQITTSNSPTVILIPIRCCGNVC
jgi:hypothetical protein